MLLKLLTKEYAANCNQLLFDNHRWCTDTIGRDHPMPHFFGDILGLNPGGTFNAADSYKIKKQRIKESELMEYQLCNTHSWSDSESEYCCVPGAHFGCSGLPCTDMSRAGKRKKRFGPTNSIYMTHGKYTEAKKVPLFVLECTPELWQSYIVGSLRYFFSLTGRETIKLLFFCKRQSM